MKVLAFWLAGVLHAFASGVSPPIFPIPQEYEPRETSFLLDGDVFLAIPKAPSKADLSVARFLQAELADRFGFALNVQRVDAVAGRRAIVIGSLTNPLVARLCAERKIRPVSAEGYVLRSDPGLVLVAGTDERGAFYGLQSLRQLVAVSAGGLEIRGAAAKDWPYKPFRGVKLFLPGRDNLPFFKRFVRDFLALYKFNKLIVEMNAGMRLDRHPELNAGWIDFARALNFSRRDRPWGPGMQYQDSAHHDTADGGVLEKEEVAELVRWANAHHVEVIPEIPSLAHSYYLLTRHRELAEIPQAEWPDTYCPSNPKSYELLFDVLEEYIAVMKPRIVHIGHDEWRMPVDVCLRCKGKDPRDLFIVDLTKIHGWLRRKGIQVAIWGDHLMEDLRGQKLRQVVTSAGYEFFAPGGLTREQVQQRVPKDILVFNWFWRDARNQGEHQDRKLQDWGFRQVYGNFTPAIRNYGQRSALAGVIGGAPSAWAATTEFNFGKDHIYNFVGTANLLWSRHWPQPAELARIVQERLPRIRRDLSGASLPSEVGDAVIPIVLPPHVQAVSASFGFDARNLTADTLRAGNKIFQAEGSRLAVAGTPAGKGAIPVGKDVSSLIFLHAAAKPAGNAPADAYVYNAPDTADLLGSYEVVYEDGFLESIPVRYGVNILAWNWDQDAASARYCYRGDPVICGQQGSNKITFFAFEWTNPRLGKAVREIRMKGAPGFQDVSGRAVTENAILLRAISAVLKRAVKTPAVPASGGNP